MGGVMEKGTIVEAMGRMVESVVERERKWISDYIRKVGREGTADDELKMSRLADAVEKGAHHE